MGVSAVVLNWRETSRRIFIRGKSELNGLPCRLRARIV